MKKWVLLVCVVLAAGTAGFYGWRFYTSPEYSLMRIQKSAEEHDITSFEHYVDVEGVVVRLLGELPSVFSAHEAGKLVGEGVVRLFEEFAKETIVRSARTAVATFIERGHIDRELTDDGVFAKFAKEVQIDDIDFVRLKEVKQEGKIAYVTVIAYVGTYDGEINATFMMRDKGFYWQIAELSDLDSLVAQVGALATSFPYRRLSGTIQEITKRIAETPGEYFSRPERALGIALEAGEFSSAFAVELARKIRGPRAAALMLEWIPHHGRGRSFSSTPFWRQLFLSVSDTLDSSAMPPGIFRGSLKNVVSMWAESYAQQREITKAINTIEEYRNHANLGPKDYSELVLRVLRTHLIEGGELPSGDADSLRSYLEPSHQEIADALIRAAGGDAFRAAHYLSEADAPSESPFWRSSYWRDIGYLSGKSIALDDVVRVAESADDAEAFLQGLVLGGGFNGRRTFLNELLLLKHPDIAKVAYQEWVIALTAAGISPAELENLLMARFGRNLRDGFGDSALQLDVLRRMAIQNPKGLEALATASALSGTLASEHLSEALAFHPSASFASRMEMCRGAIEGCYRLYCLQNLFIEFAGQRQIDKPLMWPPDWLELTPYAGRKFGSPRREAFEYLLLAAVAGSGADEKREGKLATEIMDAAERISMQQEATFATAQLWCANRDAHASAGSKLAASSDSLTILSLAHRTASSQSRLNEPRGIALDVAGNLYVADTKNNRVVKFGPEAEFITAWGKQGNRDGEFNDPCDVAVTRDGDVLVLDTWNHRVQVFDADGVLKKIIQPVGENSMWGPRGIAVSPDGASIVVADTGSKRVVIFDHEGRVRQSWGLEGSTPGRFIEPVGVVWTEDNEIVVADTGNRRIQVFAPSGKYLRQMLVSGWAEYYTEPYLATAGSRIWATDSYAGMILANRGNQVVPEVASFGSELGTLRKPVGLAVNDKFLYVSDRERNQVLRVRLLSGSTPGKADRAVDGSESVDNLPKQVNDGK